MVEGAVRGLRRVPPGLPSGYCSPARHGHPLASFLPWAYCEDEVPCATRARDKRRCCRADRPPAVRTRLDWTGRPPGHALEPTSWPSAKRNLRVSCVISSFSMSLAWLKGQRQERRGDHAARGRGLIRQRRRRRRALGGAEPHCGRHIQAADLHQMRMPLSSRNSGPFLPPTFRTLPFCSAGASSSSPSASSSPAGAAGRAAPALKGGGAPSTLPMR